MTTTSHSKKQNYYRVNPSSSHAISASDQDRMLALALQEFEADLFPLLQSLGLQQPQTTGKAIQFIGARDGEGTTTISRSCAIVAAVRLNKKVLFIESDYSSTPLLPVPADIAARAAVMAPSATAQEPTSPYESSHSTRLHSPRLGEVLQHLRQRHDFIVIDSPPANQSLDGVAISRHTDGVVLVVEAEKTRSSTVRKLQERTTKSGGHILGIVLNKRHFYIPSYIYKYL